MVWNINFIFPYIGLLSSSQLTNSYFSEGFKPPTSTKLSHDFPEMGLEIFNTHNLSQRWEFTKWRSMAAWKHMETRKNRRMVSFPLHMADVRSHLNLIVARSHAENMTHSNHFAKRPRLPCSFHGSIWFLATWEVQEIQSDLVIFVGVCRWLRRTYMCLDETRSKPQPVFGDFHLSVCFWCVCPCFLKIMHQLIIVIAISIKNHWFWSKFRCPDALCMKYVPTKLGHGLNVGKYSSTMVRICIWDVSFRGWHMTTLPRQVRKPTNAKSGFRAAPARSTWITRSRPWRWTPLAREVMVSNGSIRQGTWQDQHGGFHKCGYHQMDGL